MGLNLNLLEQLAFYGSYHSNRINQLIHFVFVPCIIWTLLIWLSYTPGYHVGVLDNASRLDVPYNLARCVAKAIWPVIDVFGHVNLGCIGSLLSSHCLFLYQLCLAT